MMETSERLTRQLLEHAGLFRSDILAVDVCSRQSADYEHKLDLFWEVWEPSADRVISIDPLEIEPVEEVPPLPYHVEEALLERLADLERAERARYEAYASSDEPDGWERREAFSAYAHIAAARAFALKRRDGYSDDVRDCLKRAWEAGYRFEPDTRSLNIWAPSGWYTTYAVTGLVLLELFHSSCTEGQYEEALHFLATGLEYLSAAVASLEIPLEELEDYCGISFGEVEDKWRARLTELLSAPTLASRTLEPQKAIDVAEQVLNHVRTADWKQVARDCEALAVKWEECFGELDEPFTDDSGNKITWRAFWYRAQGRAEEKLAPNDRRDLLNQREDEAAENRLKAYFFEGDLWNELPERAQRSLVDAERAWFSTRAGRIESVLNDLQVATESLCHCLIWEPLRKCKGDRSLLEFIEKDEKLREKGHNPTLGDYTWACKRPFFKGFVAALSLSDDDKDFLTQRLADALNRLRSFRDTAQHDPARKWRKVEIIPIFKEFLGMGCSGILPRLADIKRKVAPSVRRRGPLLPP